MENKACRPRHLFSAHSDDYFTHATAPQPSQPDTGMKKHLRQLPNAPNTFSFLGHESDDKSGVIRFRYGYDNGLEFCETLEFNHPLPAQTSPLRNAFDATLCALNVLAGVSYYKAFAPSSISLGSANFEDPQLAFFQS